MSGYGPMRELLRRFGVDVVRYSGRRFPERIPIELIHDHKISLVFDVGANVGQTAIDLRARGYRGRIVSFEPQTEAFRALARVAAHDDAWECRNVAIGDRRSNVQVNVSRNSWSSSILPMSERHRQAAPSSVYAEAEGVQLLRLDDLRNELVGRDDRLYLKLDVQGYEAQAIAGAAETLSQVVVVEAEVSLVELYEGQSLMGDFITLMRAHDFFPLHVAPEFRDPATGELLQLNMWFGRKSDVDTAVDGSVISTDAAPPTSSA
jgi:FkbM family methyltransferase